MPDTSALSNRIARLESDLAARDGEIAKLRGLLQAAQAESAKLAAERASSRPAAVAVGTNAPVVPFAPAMAGVFTNQAAMKSFRDNIRRSFQVRQRLYKDFIDQAGLTADQAREFEQLLGERRRAQFAGGWIGEDEAARRRASADGKLKELLGDKYDALGAYEQQLPARYFTEGLGLYMEEQSASLAADHKTQLIAKLSGVEGLNEDYDRFAAFRNQDGAQTKTFDELLTSSVDRATQRYDEIVRVAQPILSATEFQQLDQYLGEQLQQRETGANIARTMMPASVRTNRLPSATGATGTR